MATVPTNTKLKRKRGHQEESTLEEGERQNFTFSLKVENYSNIFRTTSATNTSTITFENYAIGNGSIIFDVDVTIADTVDVKLRRKFQCHHCVTISPCYVVITNENGNNVFNAARKYFQKKLLVENARSEDSVVYFKTKWNESMNFQAPIVPAVFLEGDALRLKIVGAAFYRKHHRKLTLQKQIKYHLNNEETSDITLIVGGERFVSHKWLLCARSPVFRAMFNSDTKESIESKVTIPDVRPKVFKRVLQFLYTDKCTHMSRMASDLLFAADKYDITGLRKLCELEMMKHISVDNVCECLVNSGLTNSTDLYKRCLEFFEEHSKDVLNSKGWRKFKKMPFSSQFMPDIIEVLGK